MKPLPPEVKGPVSECNQSIRVRGHISGATVNTLVNGNVTASQLSNWPDDVIPVGVALSAGDKITASQKFDGEVSDPSPLAITVQPVPSSLSSLTIVTHLYRCGTAVWAEGAVPGAEVQAIINNVLVGQKVSVDGLVRLNYQPGLQLSQPLTLVQTSCNSLTNTTVSVPADDLPQTLPTPVIQTPVIECETSMKLSNILDGATVTLYKNGVADGTVVFDRSSLTWIGLPPFIKGDKIEVDQAFYCNRRKSTATHRSGKASTIVQSLDKLNAPEILSPACPDSKLLLITKLKPGARVIIYQNDSPIGMTDTPSSTYAFYVPPLASGTTITARMQLCNKDGPLSNAVAVESAEGIDGLDTSTLYECASYVFLRVFGSIGAVEGLLVYILNKKGYMISGYHLLVGYDALIPISPALVAAEEITVAVVNCNGEASKFGPFQVEELGTLDAPDIIEPVPEGNSAVATLSVVAGAIVTVHVNSVYAGQAVSRGDKALTVVALQNALQLGQSVTAKQTMCGKTSKSSQAPVVIPYPKPPKLIQPADNAAAIGTSSVKFGWEDPGKNTSAQAASFKVRLYKDSNLIHEGVVSGTTYSYTLNFTLDSQTEYTWKVEATNSTGTSPSEMYLFTTEEAAPPPSDDGEVAQLVFTTSLYAGADCITSFDFFPANQPFKLFIGVGNIGNAVSEPFEVYFVASLDGQTFATDSVSFNGFTSGQTDIACVDMDGLAEDQYLFEVALIVNNQIIQNTSYGAWVGF